MNSINRNSILTIYTPRVAFAKTRWGQVSLTNGNPTSTRSRLNILKYLRVLALVMLLGVNVVMGQTTVFTDDFSANQSATYTTSGAIGASAWSITRSGVDWGGRRNTTPARLEITNDVSGTANVNGWVLASTSTSAFSSPYNTTLSSNTGLVTWTFNMRQIRTDPAGFGSGAYGVAFIIAGTSTTNNNTGSGYAVVLGQSGSTDAIRLVRYASGIQGTMTNILTSNTTGLTDFGANYVSVRVTYTPSTNTWELFLRDDGASAFVDPTTGSLTSQGTATDNTHTGTSLTIMGGWWQGSTGATQDAFFDNVSVSVTVSTSAPTLTTPTATSITDVSATLGATITADGGSAITARGTSYKTSSPVVAADNQLAEGGTAVASFSHSRTSLTPQTRYFYAGYATNTTGTALSSEGNFRTLSTAPSAQSSGVSTSVISSSQINLTISAASFPGSGATQAGYVVIYSTGTPTLSSTNGQAPAAGVGTIFTTSATNLPSTPSTAVNVTGLASGTTYNFLVVPYTWDGTNAATYNYLTASAPTASATTGSGAPALSTPTFTAITHNSATLGATVTTDGGTALTARGTSYKTSSPVIATDNQLAEGGTSVTAFSHSRTGLSPQTQYFFVGYATNSSTTSISTEDNFRTLSSPPTVQAGLSAAAFSTSQINLTITTATFPGSGATQAGYVVIYATGTPTFTATNGQAPAAGVGTIFATSATVLPATPSTTVNVNGLTQSTLYNFLVIPYTWDGTNASTYNYLTASAPTANATTQGPVNIAIQDFETSPATPTWTYSGGGSFDNTTSRFNGARSYQLPTSATMTTDNLDISNYTNVVVSVAYAATGVDSGEDLFIEVSYDNGSNWAGTGSAQLVDGTSNAAVNINSLNGARTPAGANPYTFNVSASETQVRLRFTQTGTTSATEFFWIDDVKVTGVLNTSPTIIRTPASLSGFTQTSATPSSEQTYTVSGNNLTANVSIVPPTGYEISTTTGGSFSATNPITLTQSGGDLVGEPVTIYVRQIASTLGAVSGNISHTSTGSNNPNVAVSGTRTGTYYSKSIGNLDELATWGLNTDGTGSAPANFTVDGVIYEIRNRATSSIGANWVVSGTASKVVVGDGANATDFTIPSGFTLTGTIDVSNAAELTIENATAPTFGTFATNSTLEYNNVAVTLSSAITYRNLKLTGSGTKTFPSNTTTVAGNLTFDGITINGAGSFPFSTILLAGNLTYVGTVTPPIATNSITLSTNGTAAGTQTFTGAGNTLRWFRIETTTSNTILLSTVGGSTNLLLANNSGGGITLLDGSVLNMNGNDFQLFNGPATSSAFVMTTGTISTTPATDFTLERTGNGNLGTLRFTTGANTIGNFTLNHTGSSNTVTIGNALNVTGVVTVTDGTLASGGNITLKSDASNTASVAAIGVGGSITGNVTAERFIPSSTRNWRFISPSVSGSNFDDWQNEIFITGTGGSTNGFDQTGNNSPGVFWYDETINSGWVSPGNITTAHIVGKGYRVFIRGDRSDIGRLTGTNTTQNAVVINTIGTINSGNINMPITFTSNEGVGWNLIGNPYPSAFNWNEYYNNCTTGCYSNIDPIVWAYDASANNYLTYNATSGGTLLNGVIPNGASFWVKANAATPTLQFREAYKTTLANSSTYKTANSELKIELKQSGSTNADYFILLHKPTASALHDGFDIPKMYGAINLMSFGSDNIMHSLDCRPELSSLNDTVQLSISATSGNYSFNIQSMPISTKYYYLKDKLLNHFIPLNANTIYPFTVSSSNTQSSGNRFYIVASNSSSLPVSYASLTAVAVNNESQINWSTASETNTSHFEIERSTNGIDFIKIGNVDAAKNSTQIVHYAFIDANPELENYYRLKQVDLDGKFEYSAMVRVLFKNTVNNYAVWPSPAGNLVQINNLTDDEVTYQISNVMGQPVKNGSISATHNSIDIQQLEKGIYFISLQTISDNTVLKFVKE